MGENTADAQPSRVRRTTDAAHAGLDVMLSEAATGGTPRFVAPGAAVKVSVGLARHPGRAASRAARLTSELRHVVSGRSDIEPPKGDRRFTDPAWTRSWLFRRLLQGYLAVGETVDGLISDSDVGWRAERRARLAAGNVVDALAPTNFPWSNPEVLKETITTGGENLVRGARQLRARPRHSPTAARDGRHAQVRGRPQPRDFAGLRRAAHRRVRADPVHSPRPSRCARFRCCSCRRRSTSTTCSTSRPAAA